MASHASHFCVAPNGILLVKESKTYVKKEPEITYFNSPMMNISPSLNRVKTRLAVGNFAMKSKLNLYRAITSAGVKVIPQSPVRLGSLSMLNNFVAKIFVDGVIKCNVTMIGVEIQPAAYFRLEFIYQKFKEIKHYSDHGKEKICSRPCSSVDSS
ncbi:hypothetical protein NQ317_007052 [Molorchus minor]|uniref:Uncharacterized protein n=1 Tax=Molorchus minor TaxID=1323400 RepID=A0ABQ9K6V7_9CUCU|nr:hypothetical protein NQ317_007052 [Molorchus minor]